MKRFIYFIQDVLFRTIKSTITLMQGYDFIHKAYSFDDQSSTNLFTKRINKFTSAVIEPSIRVYLALDSCKDDINKDEITDMLKFFTSLRHFAIYMRFVRSYEDINLLTANAFTSWERLWTKCNSPKSKWWLILPSKNRWTSTSTNLAI
jgi:hypothetical protein